MADLRATPYANPLTGLTNDAIQGLLAFMQDKKRTQQLQGLGNLLESTGIPKTVERAAYADSPRGLLDALTNVNRANVPFLKPETAEALLTLSPVPSGANRAAMAVGRAGERVAERVVPQILERGGLPAGLLQDLAQGTKSNVIELGSEFLGKKPPKIENLAKTSDKFLFHSSTSDKAKDLKYGVEPQAGGSWVREIAAGATDENLDDFFETVVPLAWFSDKPEWIKAMVGRKLNKPFDKVTAKDIEEHGHLAFINKKSPEAENITYISEQGLMEGPQSIVFDVNKENPKKAWQTGLYQEGRYGSRLEPFGVERNEYVSPESIEPLIQLTGPELVRFMRLKGLLE
jgi:hypothetical protein